MIAESKLVRNCKLLQAINIGAKVVNINWLNDSAKNNEFLDITEKYYVIDKEFEK